MSHVSAVVITYNEEKNIGRCLSSLRFCDEIIVVDSGSDDQTSDIAADYTDKLFVRPWKGYADQKNYAVQLASSEWVLSVDADEEVSDDLKQEIRRITGSSGRSAAYSIPRKTIHSGKWIRYGGWYPNRLVRLFRKSQGRWVGEEVHERWETPGEVGNLKEPLIHYSFNGISDQVKRNDRYSTLGAKSLQREGKKFSLFRLLVKPFSKFVETYVLKRGFLDGFPGFFISVSAAYSVFLKWAKLWELERSEKKR